MNSVLLLNASYEPLKVIDWKKAMTLILLDKAEIVEARPDCLVRSARQTFCLPSVAKLKNMARWRRQHMRFSRTNVFRRDDFTCQYCTKRFRMADLSLDHVIPRSKGGRTKWTNIVTACKPCNGAKEDRTPSQAGMKLAREPFVPRWFDGVLNSKAQHVESWRVYLGG